MKFMERDVRSNDCRQGYGYQSSNEFPVTYTPIRSGVFNIYLFGPIECAEQFIPAIEVLQAAGENDLVVINLQTPGGSVDAADTFISAMRDCEARIYTKATGGVHSAGTMILLESDEFMLSENFNALIHCGSLGTGGKFSDWASEVDHSKRFMSRLMHSTYQGFLSESEIENLLRGVDIWLDGAEFSTRWEARNDAIKQKIEDAGSEVLREMLAKVDAADAIANTPAPVPKRVRKGKAKPPVEESAL